MITDWSTIWAFLYCAFMSCITLGPRPNGRHFADEIFECTFVNENVWIPIKISLKFVPKGLINNIPALVQIMAWRRAGDKPLSEPMMVSLPTHICVTRPQWDMVVHVHGNVHNLLCITMNINFWWEQSVHDIFFYKRLHQKYVIYHNYEFLGNTHRFIFNNVSPPLRTIVIGIECHWSRSCTAKVS